MSTLSFRSPVTKPLLRKGTPKPVPPDPRAYDTFRITQQFHDPDAFHKDGRKHNAVDIGNFRCGDPIVAMAAGTVRRVKDNARALGAKTDALGVVIDHGHGIVTEMWHLDGYAGPASGPVVAGQQIGILGRTGLGDVCHLHVEAKRDGVKFDPEPLMFGGSVNVEAPMALEGLVTVTIASGNRLRPDPAIGDDYKLLDFTASDYHLLGIEPNGGRYTLGGATRTDWARVRRGSEWWVAAPLVANPRLTAHAARFIPPADCSAQEQTIAQLQNRIAGARTANAGARQAQEAVEAALR